VDNKEPTEEQIKELWTFCGFKITPNGIQNKSGTWIKKNPDDYFYPNKHWGKAPKITLDNLFKYAIPQIKKNGMNYRISTDGDYLRIKLVYRTSDTASEIVGRDLLPELALFWAIYEVIKSDKSKTAK
jgi:hypothetical protein